MQPEPHHTTNLVSHIPDCSESSQPSQHGSLPEPLPAAALHAAIEDGRVKASGSNDLARAKQPSFGDEESTPLQILSLRGRPFLEALTDGFPALDGRRLDNLPNEVLTHILSHLPAATLTVVSLVSKKFYSLVTTPHAWRIAFSRFFPGQGALESSSRNFARGAEEQLRSEHRAFTQLTSGASWRSEYILRTRLLRGLARGKPVQLTATHAASRASMTYSSRLFATINHLHATFSSETKAPHFIHGTDETSSAGTSDPSSGKVDNWGLSDPQVLPQFADLFLGEQLYGAGDGPAGVPNCMDVSELFGMVCGEGFPGGKTYFRSHEELRGRFLDKPSGHANHSLGVPRFPASTEAISAVWIAKSEVISRATCGIVGIMTGSTLGVVSTYSLGSITANGRRIRKGELTLRWVLSPGVPIVSIRVDDSYNSRRKESRRIWAVVLNALGELFYLTDTPSTALFERNPEQDIADSRAWCSGRTVHWHLVEPSRRKARDDPYQKAEIHGTYSPRSSSDRMQLTTAQIVAETIEIENFLRKRPSVFRKLCLGWDMLRRLEGDFAGDEWNGAGENFVVISSGAIEGDPAMIRRFTRYETGKSSTILSATRPTDPFPRKLGSVDDHLLMHAEGWLSSVFSLKDQPGIEITTSAIDMSTFATLWAGDYPSANVAPESAIAAGHSIGAAVPGGLARFIAVGSTTGRVLLWNMRGNQPANPELVNEIQTLRIIYTDSPQITCLALSALYVVHGGNDGLVQAWDPLASTMQPLRTLNSRFSSRARRRLFQAEASEHGVGINLYAAGAIALDPNPTTLRGMVSLGTHLRYWSYSSSAADKHSGKKRRLRRLGQRGTNSALDRVTSTGRGALMDYIATEQEELRNEKIRRSREEARLRGRFGLGLGGLSEEEALHYAEMVSVETFQQDEARRVSDAGYFADMGESSSFQTTCSNTATVTPEGSIRGATTPSKSPHVDEKYDHDLEEAIRLSLLDGVDEGGRSPRASGSGEYRIPVTYKQRKGRRSASSSPSTSQVSRYRAKASSSMDPNAIEAVELEAALQLSLTESRIGHRGIGDGLDSFPDVQGKGKGRADAV